MAVLHSFRRWQDRIARVAVGLFALTWLGLALEPCHAVPNDVAPPAPVTHDVGSPCHEAATPPATGDDGTPGCPHCPAQHPAEGDCGRSVAAVCGTVSAPALEQRDLTPGKLPLVIPTSWVLPDPGLEPQGPAGPLAAPPEPPPAGSFQERYCTHLE